MRKVVTCLALSLEFIIFANANFGERGFYILRFMLHDRPCIFNTITTMPLFRITVKSRVNTNGIRLEPGMSVDVVSQSFSDPVHTNGGQSVADAFMRIYGVDKKRAGALNGVCLKVDSILYP